MLGINAFMRIVIGMLVAVIQPYKAKVYNIVDTILILSVGLGFASGMSALTASILDYRNRLVTYVSNGYFSNNYHTPALLYRLLGKNHRKTLFPVTMFFLCESHRLI